VVFCVLETHRLISLQLRQQLELSLQDREDAIKELNNQVADLEREFAKAGKRKRSRQAAYTTNAEPTNLERLIERAGKKHLVMTRMHIDDPFDTLSADLEEEGEDSDEEGLSIEQECLHEYVWALPDDAKEHYKEPGVQYWVSV
jgi:hypothetical protein